MRKLCFIGVQGWRLILDNILKLKIFLGRNETICILTIFLATSFSLISCDKLSGDLTRSKAESILKSQPSPVFSFVARFATSSMTHEFDTIKRLSAAGFGTYTSGQNLAMGEFLQFTPSPQLQALIVNNPTGIGGEKVIVGYCVVSNVTGILKESETTARVQFTGQLALNEVGKIIGTDNFITDQCAGSMQAYFQKYDDGWRLVM